MILFKEWFCKNSTLISYHEISIDNFNSKDWGSIRQKTNEPRKWYIYLFFSILGTWPSSNYLWYIAISMLAFWKIFICHCSFIALDIEGYVLRWVKLLVPNFTTRWQFKNNTWLCVFSLYKTHLAGLECFVRVS